MIHWLQFDSMTTSAESARLKLLELKRYLVKHPEATAIGYLKTEGDIYARFARLDCCQDYDALDMVCNSFSNNSLRHLERKPCNVEWSQYLTRLINSEN